MKREYNLVLFIVNCDIENKDPISKTSSSDFSKYLNSVKTLVALNTSSQFE